MHRTHETVRTLTCLARKLSLASRLERSNQTNNSRRWPSVPCFPCCENQNYWKLELAPFRCSVPHSPSWRRVSQVRLRGCCAAVSLSNACFLVHGPCGLNFHFQCNEIGGSLPHTGRFRATCTATGSRFTRNLLTIPRPPAPGQADWSEIHVKRALSSPPAPPGSPCSTLPYCVEHDRVEPALSPVLAFWG